MTIPLSQPPQSGRTLNRHLILELVEHAFFMGKYRFARQALLAWLANFPGDLPVSLLYAQSLLRASQADQALPVLERLCRIDPEYLEAARLRLDALLRLQAEKERGASFANPGSRQVSDALGCLLALGERVEADESENRPILKSPGASVWSQPIQLARQAMQRKNG